MNNQYYQRILKRDFSGKIGVIKKFFEDNPDTWFTMDDIKKNADSLAPTKKGYYDIVNALIGASIVESRDSKPKLEYRLRKNVLITNLEIDKILFESSSDKLLLRNIFEKHGFRVEHETDKVIGFIKDTSAIYLRKNTNNISVTIHPQSDITVYSDKFSKRFHTQYSSNMNLFPKKMNNGKTLIHYGLDIDLISFDELDKFLTEYKPNNLINLEEMHLRKPRVIEYDIIKDLDEKYSGKPNFVEIVVKEKIQRPSDLRDAILKKRGASCQICNYSGFIKKDGSIYAETHHMIELNAQAPNTLQSWNILVLCPICHKKMHYGDVSSTYLNPGWKIIFEKKEIILK